MRVLFVAANPAQTAKAMLEDELRELELLRNHPCISLTALHATRPDDLVRTVREEKPTVVHFSGRGTSKNGHGAKGIVLQNEKGNFQPVSPQSLREFFVDRGVELVVLNTCFSKEQGAPIAKSVPMVIGTKRALDDDAGRRFTARFYAVLASGLSVAEAFRDATAVVSMYGKPDMFESYGNLDRCLYAVESPEPAQPRPSRPSLAKLTRELTHRDPEASAELISRTLTDHLGKDDAVDLARVLVEHIERERKASGAELFDATRSVVEYFLLLADDLTPASICKALQGESEEGLRSRSPLYDDVSRKPIEVEPHDFFSRVHERQKEWYEYFKAVAQLADPETVKGSSLCTIRTHGFVSPQFLVAGLLPRFEEDWRPLIKEYQSQVSSRPSAFAHLQASQWNTWLMWGPSIPLCQCEEWDGIRALQYGYGDENNSIPVIGPSEDDPSSLDYPVTERPIGAAFRWMKGRLRWAPWLLRQRTHVDTPRSWSGGFSVSALRLFGAARAQRLVYDRELEGDTLILQAENVDEHRAVMQSYFSAYLWLMFLVARKPEPGQAPRRLSGEYPPLDAAAKDRKAEHLWRELLPVYVHANIADDVALGMHRRTLVNNAIGLLRQLWTDRATLFPGVPEGELCFSLVGGSDYTGCGHKIRFPSNDTLLARLRARVAEEPNKDFVGSILLPADSVDERPDELALFYSTCHLPDLIADYYDYVVDV